MYKPKYFKLHELLPAQFYHQNEYREDVLWWIFDPRLLWTIDQLRKIYGPLICNTWQDGGPNPHQFRGWRPFDCDVGASLSQHKFGRAVDLVPVKISAEEIREDILGLQMGEPYKHITCIEADVPWLHIDVRNWNRVKFGVKVVKRN